MSKPYFAERIKVYWDEDDEMFYVAPSTASLTCDSVEYVRATELGNVSAARLNAPAVDWEKVRQYVADKCGDEFESLVELDKVLAAVRQQIEGGR